jgi:thiamine kinase-like enzyme
VDFEYAGLGPAALDLAFSLGEPKDTQDFLAGYQAGDGKPDLASVLSLARIRPPARG